MQQQQQPCSSYSKLSPLSIACTFQLAWGGVWRSRTQDYSEQNSIVVPRAQFLCIEAARDREGCNLWIRSDLMLLQERRISMVYTQSFSHGGVDVPMRAHL